MQHEISVSRLAPGLCLFLSLFVALPAAAADPGEQPEVPDAWPKFMKKAMKKESRTKKTASFRSENGEVEGAILGKLIIGPQAFEGGWAVGTDLGGDEPVTCYVYTSHRNLANSVEGIHTALVEGIAKNNAGELKDRIPYYVNSGVIDDVPFVTSEWIYTVNTEEGVKAGLTKVRGAKKQGATLICAHTELGYRATFARLFEEFVTDTVVQTELGEPYYREVLTIKLGDKPAGIASATYTIDEEGDTRIDLVTSMLLQVDGRTLMTSDSTKLEYSTPWGTVINAYDFTVQNNTVTSDLALEYDDERGWHVDGSFGGKDVSLDLDATEAPLSALGQMYAVRTALGDEDGRTGFYAWVADADPSRFVDASIQIDERGDATHDSTLTLGPLVMDAKMDDAGSLVAGNVAMGPNIMTLTRVLTEGSVPDPSPQ